MHRGAPACSRAELPAASHMLNRVDSQLHSAQAQLPLPGGASLMLPPSSLQALVAAAVLLSLGLCWATALWPPGCCLHVLLKQLCLSGRRSPPILGSTQLISRVCSRGWKSLRPSALQVTNIAAKRALRTQKIVTVGHGSASPPRLPLPQEAAPLLPALAAPRHVPEPFGPRQSRQQAALGTLPA